MNSDHSFTPFLDISQELSLIVTSEMVIALFWVLAGVSAVIVLILTYHLSSYSISKTKASLLIGIEVSTTLLLLLAAFSSATLF